MSEYQYYEFLAIDQPLTADEMAKLRALSTRATITPVSFTNEYNWGDFKDDPDKLMQRYFDAHVYVANWMTAIFMVRLPTGNAKVDRCTAKRRNRFDPEAIAGGQGTTGRTICQEPVCDMATWLADGRYRRTPAYGGRIAAERRKGASDPAGKVKTVPQATGSGSVTADTSKSMIQRLTNLR